MSRSVYHARVQRSGEYWAIYVPDVDRWTQARTPDEIEPMTRDLISAVTGVDSSSFELEVSTVPESHS